MATITFRESDEELVAWQEGHFIDIVMSKEQSLRHQQFKGPVLKKYDKPKTPFQRLMECETFPDEKKEELRKIKATLNPIVLQAQLQKKLVYFHKLNDAYNEKVQGKSS